jgi:hypothetical protein
VAASEEAGGDLGCGWMIDDPSPLRFAGTSSGFARRPKEWIDE